jgi:hypothetical protein
MHGASEGEEVSRCKASQRFDNHAATFYDADSDLATIEQSHAQQGSALGGERANGTFDTFPEHSGAVHVQRGRRPVGQSHVASAQEWQLQATCEGGRQSEVAGEARIYDDLDLGGVPKGTCHCEGYDGLPSPGDYRAGDRHGAQARRAPGYPVLGLPMRADGRPGSPTG